MNPTALRPMTRNRSRGNIHNTLDQKNYTLDIRKNINKKLEACRRPDIDYSFTNGGITAKANAVTFELITQAMRQFYSQETSSHRQVKINTSHDKKGLLVQTTYKVTCDPATNTGYTINVYHTNSSFMVNGKASRQFMFTDLKLIHDVMGEIASSGEQIQTEELQTFLSERLSDLLKSTNSGQLVGANGSEQSSQISVQDIKCKKCHRNCNTRAAYCELGLHWIHYRCDKLTTTEIELIETANSPRFQCKQCVPHPGKVKQTKSKSPVKLAIPIPSPPRVKTTEGSPSGRESQTKPKTIAEDILSEEMTPRSCGNCDQQILDTATFDSCDVCYSWCHVGCMIDTDENQTCYACDQAIRQVTSPTVQDEEPLQDNQHQSEKVNKSLEVQTISINLIDLEKREAELKTKEKSLKKKELEYTQTTKQLTAAKTKIATLEQSYQDLQKENDLLRTSLLLAQTSDRSTNKQGQTDPEASPKQVPEQLRELEKRVQTLEMDSMRGRIERLEALAKDESKHNSEAHYRTYPCPNLPVWMPPPPAPYPEYIYGNRHPKEGIPLIYQKRQQRESQRKAMGQGKAPEPIPPDWGKNKEQKPQQDSNDLTEEKQQSFLSERQIPGPPPGIRRRPVENTEKTLRPDYPRKGKS